MAIKILDTATVQNLHSGQVIVDLEAIVKELLENSLDAQATSIEFKFEDNGLESIQIKDNGDGIEEVDRAYVAKQHYTSKLQEFQDLEKIQSYGFRGEAMNSICSISDKLTLVTKTKNDPIAKQYEIDKNGSLSNEEVTNSIIDSGTILTIYKPFYNLPVRRQLAQKNATSNMKKIQDLLIKYALAHPTVRFSSIQVKMNERNNWIKPITSSIENTLLLLYGATLTNMLERFIETNEDHDKPLTVDVVLPKPNSDPSVILKGPERIYFYVNQRPINYVKSELKEIVSMIKNRYREAIGLTEITGKKSPFIYVDIQLPPSEYDVNIEPNKTTILFHNKEQIINLIKKVLDTIYPSKVNQFFHKTPIMHDAPNEDLLGVTGSDDNNDNTAARVLGAKTSMETWQIDDASDTTHETNGTSWNPINTSSSHTNHKVVNNPQRTSTTIPKKRHPELNEGERITKYMKTHTAVVSPKANTHVPTIPFLSSSSHPRSPSIDELTPPSQVIAPPNAPVITPPVNSTRPLNEPSLSETQSTPTVLHISSPKPHVPTQPKPRRDITSLFKGKKKPNHPPNIQQLCNTLNQSLTIDCDLDIIKRTYPKRKEILSETYRIRIEDYLNMNDYGHAEQTANLVEMPNGLNKYGLSFYTRGNPSLLDHTKHQIYQLGVVKLKPLYIDGIIKRLKKEYKLNCKKLLDRPVQIRMNHQDRLCPVILRLKSKESYVDDDMHGSKKITYSEIVDDSIVDNGFRVRWRKDLTSENLIIQFTGIHTLITGYGTSDFKEILSLMIDSKKGEFIRPKKVLQYFKSLAEEIYQNQPNEKDLETALDSLIWKKEDEQRELGYSSDSGQVLACKLI